MLINEKLIIFEKPHALCRQNCLNILLYILNISFKKYFCIAKARLLHRGGSVCMAKDRYCIAVAWSA